MRRIVFKTDLNLPSQVNNLILSFKLFYNTILEWKEADKFTACNQSIAIRLKILSSR